jgi:hypothetical protein
MRRSRQFYHDRLPCRRSERKIRQKELLFVNKKKPKTWLILASGVKAVRSQTNESFLVLFFKKEPLAVPVL